jgi:hypothetical protein
MKTTFAIFFLSLFYISLSAQTDIEIAEDTIVKALLKLRSNEQGIDKEAVANQFETLLTKALSKKESWEHRFSKLRKYINVKRSHDKKIRTFGWDSRLGGSWHTLITLIQYKTPTGVSVFSFQKKSDDFDYPAADAYRDAVVIDIYQLKKGYLLEAWGTHGSGHHHRIFAYYEFENGALVRKPAFAESKNYYVLVIPRRDKFGIEVNTQTEEISHYEFVLDDDIGFYKPTGKRKTVQLHIKQ